MKYKYHKIPVSDRLSNRQVFAKRHLIAGARLSLWLLTGLCLSLVVSVDKVSAQNNRMPIFSIQKDNISWPRFSLNAAGSMPLGGGDIGLNVWTEQGDILFYMAKSDAFDQNNTLLKLGRIRIHVSPNPFVHTSFNQSLHLQDGSIYIKGSVDGRPVTLHLWVDVRHPAIHGNLTYDHKGPSNLNALITYESWRDKDHTVKGKQNNQNSYKFGPQGIILMKKDSISTGYDQQTGGRILFFHANGDKTVFDVTVHQQKLDSVKNELYDPLKNRISGGLLCAPEFMALSPTAGTYLSTPYTGYRLGTRKPVAGFSFHIQLSSTQTPDLTGWVSQLKQSIRTGSQVSQDWAVTRQWWQSFWQRSFIDISPDYNTGDDSSPKRAKDSSGYRYFTMGRNYQLFRYMLGANAYGKFPTKFNGGLFTYDPVLVDSTYPFTPDFRNWGGGTFTAQNQRLVYFPMLKSGDFDLLQSSFDFYNRLLKTAELRSLIYWHHKGAAFTEQLENFGLPNPSEYSWKRPPGYDPGMQYNAWLEYEWDTVLEFCKMMLDARDYNNTDIRSYLPFIKSCLSFFDAHYQYLAEKRGARTLDGNGHLILYPGSGAETYKLAYNASSTIAALKTITGELLELPDTLLDKTDRDYVAGFQKRIPPLPLTRIKGKEAIAPAITWARINNQESPQLYPVYPWGIYGVGKPDLDIALNTWNLDTNVIKNRSYIGWKQDNIFAARLGLARQAFDLTALKLKDGPRRFPAFWGPGFDWVPDHNWGGSAMIGLQEMLLQTAGDSIILFAAWPKDIDVHFKLHATRQTTVEAWLKNGKLSALKVLPAYRQKDIINYLDKKPAAGQ
ncbi:DUF5703 domain-containing protein [Arachidicoccus rhizosphaerae]|nr:DUF5703 domain-containing protein [Arachidicoccus rhizosphaerae]